jgi:type II secretory pathway component PulF
MDLDSLEGCLLHSPGRMLKEVHKSLTIPTAKSRHVHVYFAREATMIATVTTRTTALLALLATAVPLVESLGLLRIGHQQRHLAPAMQELNLFLQEDTRE